MSHGGRVSGPHRSKPRADSGVLGRVCAHGRKVSTHRATSSAGWLNQRGAPRDLLAAPQTPFAARLAGVAVVSGVVHDEATVTVDGHRVRIEIDLDRPHSGFDASVGDVS